MDEHQSLVIDARTSNEGDGWAGSGANPWHLDGQTNSILFLTDEGNKPVRIGVDVTAGLVHYYLIRLKLAPHETRAIDFRALRDAQVPDFKAGGADIDFQCLRSARLRRFGMALLQGCSLLMSGNDRGK